jgi:peroxiredoxin Q/BCP
MAEELKVGSSIPPFFLKDHEGFDVTDEDVLGTPLVLYFYAKDATPTCTEEACAIRDNQQKFDLLQTLVIGISPDSVESHKKFLHDNKLQFSLLSDVKKDMAQMFGVLNEKNEVIRTTFVIDSQGVIKWMEKPVNVKGHIERVLKAIEEHCKEEVIKFDEFEQDYADFLQSKKQTPDEQKGQIKPEFGIKKNDGEKKKK